jgi:hypothetical protein
MFRHSSFTGKVDPLDIECNDKVSTGVGKPIVGVRLERTGWKGAMLRGRRGAVAVYPISESDSCDPWGMRNASIKAYRQPPVRVFFAPCSFSARRMVIRRCSIRLSALRARRSWIVDMGFTALVNEQRRTRKVQSVRDTGNEGGPNVAWCRPSVCFCGRLIKERLVAFHPRCAGFQAPALPPS